MSIDPGYEATSLELVEDVLDSLSPATSEEVFLLTRDIDSRAVAAVAAARADAGGGGGSDDQTAAEVAFTPTGAIAATDVQAAIAELDAEKLSAIPTLTWTNVTGGIGFSNGWDDFGSGTSPVAYAKDANFVYFKGVASGASKTGDAAFTLPSGFRPAALRFIAPAILGPGDKYISVATSGVVTINAGTSDNPCFDSLRFAL